MASLHQRPRTRGRPSPNYFTCTHRRVPRTYTKASLIPGHFNRPIEQPSQPAPPITSDNGRVAACDPIPTRETPRRRLHTTGTESLVAGLGCRGQHRREPPPPAASRKGMAPRRRADGCIRRPPSSRWTRQAAPTAKRAKGGIRAGLTSRCGTRAKAKGISDSRVTETADTLGAEQEGRETRRRLNGRGRGADGAAPTPTGQWSALNARPLDAPPDTWPWPAPPSQAGPNSALCS